MHWGTAAILSLLCLSCGIGLLLFLAAPLPSLVLVWVNKSQKFVCRAKIMDLAARKEI